MSRLVPVIDLAAWRAGDRSVAEALATARATPVVTVLPKVETIDGQQMLTIPEEAGYGRIAEPLTSIRG